jgi:hypothetical protein
LAAVRDNYTEAVEGQEFPGLWTLMPGSTRGLSLSMQVGVAKHKEALLIATQQGLVSAEDKAWLWVEEAQQLGFVAHAEGGPYAHVANNGARYSGRKSLWRVMATRAVLLEDAGSCVLMFLLDMNGGMAFVWLRAGWSSLRRRLRESNR